MWKYALLISYDGTDFCGWQKQAQGVSGNLPSVQITLENAIHQISGDTSSVVGSGRTDSGVHALGQVAHLVLKTRAWQPEILLRSLNGVLPASIRVLAVQEVPLDFHAQRSAVRKQYSYYFQQGPCALPHLVLYSRWIRKDLDRSAMQTALNHLVGEHDFKPFQASGARPGATRRVILEAKVESETFPLPKTTGLIRIRIVGTGFLKQMVRGITGTLLQVGEGYRPADCFQEILITGDRRMVGPTAPARALWLERVWYPPELGLFADLFP